MEAQAIKTEFNVGKEFLKKIQNRMLRENKNWLCAICGGTGSGKTYSAITLADKICKGGWNPEKHLAFTPREFMEKVTNPKTKRGDIIIFDEAGVGMSSKEWFSIQNRLLSYVLQTFRHKNLGIIFTMPGLNLIDKSARMLFHSYFETKKILKKPKLCVLKPYDFQYNSIQDKLYKKIPKFVDESGQLIYMPEFLVDLPKPRLIKLYEQKKTEYTDKLNRDIIAELDMQEEKKKPDTCKCSMCGKNQWRFYKKDNSWQCRQCGNTVFTNPYAQ
jgi:ribosomal protein L37AE/L43A